LKFLNLFPFLSGVPFFALLAEDLWASSLFSALPCSRIGLCTVSDASFSPFLGFPPSCLFGAVCRVFLIPFDFFFFFLFFLPLSLGGRLIVASFFFLAFSSFLTIHNRVGTPQFTEDESVFPPPSLLRKVVFRWNFFLDSSLFFPI